MVTFIYHDKSVFGEKGFQVIKAFEALHHAQIDDTSLPVSSAAHLADEARGKAQELADLEAPLIQDGFSMRQN